uniref:NADH-ubiquinone oxidoreductase chain 5 n=1 Tax=Pisione sp. YZ-2018 TaxID=2153337 RepID=A0A343W6I8_9ANNE|nr:NADH dehydrogenase subunit 5 [Pisione sp. YZ-2018]
MSIIPQRASFLLWSLFPFPLLTSFYLFSNDKLILISWNFLSSISVNMSLPFILDSYGCLFSAVVLFISANVLMFSSSYMHGDVFMQRFIILVLLFVLSMNFLIFIPNLICLLIGWDGLGIVSFILVIYYQNSKSLAAGMITALMNRIGDVMILLSIALMLNNGHWSILFLWDTSFSSMYVLLLMIAAMTKSAQIPFSSWLPAAMAAPTPVSALVHSSTLVTAGVFLLFRFHYFFSSFFWFNPLLLIIATLTMFMAGTSAIAECDMKKIIALSTLSQLGVMMSSLGLGLTTLTFFHLLTHALFKALLFLTAGSMIHFHHHSQDLRFMGSVPNTSPLTISCLSLANLALCGSPFMAGFYSKDLILESLVFSPFSLVIVILFFLATGMTASYSIRFMLTVLWTQPLSLPASYLNDSDSKMTFPMMFLSLGAIFSGALLAWNAFFNIDEPILPFYLKLLALIVTIIGLWIAFSLTLSHYSLWISLPLSHYMAASMWMLVPSMSQGTIQKPLLIALNFLKTLDQGWIEFSGPQGIFSLSSSSSKSMLSSQSSPITTHLSMILVFMFFLILS